MKNRQLFPLGKAYGDAFCNRTDETKKLLGNIRNAKHTLIIAPRRYGKSSLAERAIALSELPSIKINLHLCTSEEEVSTLILDSVNCLMGKAIGNAEKLMSTIKKYISNLEPIISFGGEKASLKLIPKNHTNHAVVISESLLLLEKLLEEKNKRAVIFLDEFQEIDKISKESAIEGAFRTAAQEMHSLAIVFSGSVRSLLLSMFEDENRPLYKLCRKIKLERIDAQHYEEHIQKIAKNTWGEILPIDVFQAIMHFSNRHPYYVNYLSDIVWENNETLPSIESIETAWHTVVKEEWSDALRELSELPIGQRRLLKHIATHEAKNMQSHETSQSLSMPPSSISTALTVLIEKDYIEKNENGFYEIINPLLFAVLCGAVD